MKIRFLTLSSFLIAWMPPGIAGEPPLTPGAWTLVHIPDTQNYVSDAARTGILNAEIDWIRSQRAARNIRFAVQVGDLTNDNGDLQWDRARAAFEKLDGAVPLAACTGNHDCGPGGSGDSRATQFFLPSRFGAGSPYAEQATFRGAFQHPDDPTGNTQNSWHTFRAGDQDFLVLTCEWGPRDAVVAWMNETAAAHPWHRVILVAHAYLESGTQRYDWNDGPNGMNPHSFGIASGPGGVNDGQELWEKLVRNHENFCLVCCGHSGAGFRTVTGVHGNRVHEMLYNTQDLPNGGNGLLRLLEFLPDNRTVQARTYSTHLDEWSGSAAQSFRFKLSPVSTVDSDADGLPDYHEVQQGWSIDSPANGSDDADHDGATNLEEYLARTSPKDPASVLAVDSVSLTANALTLTWASVPGMTYLVEERPGAEGAWSPAGSAVTASAFSTTATVAGTADRKFLRVRVVQD